MAASIRDEEMETEGPQKDVELTLGPAMLLGFVCGLLLLCGLCFGVGYTAGRRNGLQMVAAKVAASGQTLGDQATAGAHKPAATVATPPPETSSPASSTTSVSPGTASAGGPTPPTNVPAVRPAMTPEGSPTQTGSSAAARAQPPLAPGAGIMVQIAAVSHVEDANVLMSALRKRGYTVTARRDVDDNLIHVQLGPFADRAEANAMSQRLLNDGYNAVVLP